MPDVFRVIYQQPSVSAGQAASNLWQAREPAPTIYRNARKAPSFRAGMNSADGSAVLWLFNAVFVVVRCTAG